MRRTSPWKPCGTPRWPRRGCASCSWPPASGAMPAGWASATATITRRKARFRNSWTGCAESLAVRMDLLLSSPRRYAPDPASSMAHRFLCTSGARISNTYRTGPGKSKARGKLRNSRYRHNTLLNRSGAQRALRPCIIQVSHHDAADGPAAADKRTSATASRNWSRRREAAGEHQASSLHGNTPEALERIAGLFIDLSLIQAHSIPAAKVANGLTEFEI